MRGRARNPASSPRRARAFANCSSIFHPAQHRFGIVAAREQVEEQCVGARIVAHFGGNEARIAVRLAHRRGLDLVPFGFGDAEYLDQPHRIVAEPVVARRADPPAEHAVALDHARPRPEPREQPAPRARFRELLVDMGEEHAGQAADPLGLEEVELHEALDLALARAVGEIHPLGDLALEVEGQPVLGPPGDHVEMAAHREQEALGAAEALVFLRGEQVDVDQLGGAAHLVDVLADPVERLEIAQPALAVLDVGFDDVAAVAHALVPGVALFQLLADELAFGAGDDFGPEAPPRRVVKRLVAPDVAPLEQRGADGDVFLRHAHHVVGRAARMTDLQPQVPQVVERGLDHLFAPRRAAGRGQEGDIDVRMRRHLRAAVAADREDREPLALRAVRRGIDVAGDMVVDQPHELVDQEGVPRDAFVPRVRLGLEPPAQFLAALLEGLAQGLDHRAARLVAAFGGQRGDPLRQGAPVDYRALLGDADLVQVSSGSLLQAARTARLSIFCVPSRGSGSSARQMACGILNGAIRPVRNSRSSPGVSAQPSLQ